MKKFLLVVLVVVIGVVAVHLSEGGSIFSTDDLRHPGIVQSFERAGHEDEIDSDHPENVAEYLVKRQESEGREAYDSTLMPFRKAFGDWNSNWKPVKNVKLVRVENVEHYTNKRAKDQKTFHTLKMDITYTVGDDKTQQKETIVAKSHDEKDGPPWDICPYGIVDCCSEYKWDFEKSGLMIHGLVGYMFTGAGVVFLGFKERDDHQNGVSIGWAEPPTVTVQMEDGYMEYPQNGSLAQQCGIVMPQGQLRVSHDHPVIAMYPLPEGKKEPSVKSQSVRFISWGEMGFPPNQTGQRCILVLEKTNRDK